MSTNQHKGNCTWHVCYQYGAVPFRGNAGTWWNQVPNYANWRRGYRPQRGENIAWWGGNPGHVAYVSNYQGGSQVTISEMSWCESCGRSRTVAVTNPGGYIWRTGPQPTTSTE
ncbi:MAG: CHAP domain-containing protein [Anaerolineae bacterium]